MGLEFFGIIGPQALDIIDLKKIENGKVFDFFLLVWLIVSWYV
jgi:hypothetical protein